MEIFGRCFMKFIHAEIRRQQHVDSTNNIRYKTFQYKKNVTVLQRLVFEKASA